MPAVKRITFAAYDDVAQHVQVAAVPRQIMTDTACHIHTVTVRAAPLMDHAIVLKQPVISRSARKALRVEKRAADNFAVPRGIAATTRFVSTTDCATNPQPLHAEIV